MENTGIIKRNGGHIMPGFGLAGWGNSGDRGGVCEAAVLTYTRIAGGRRERHSVSSSSQPRPLILAPPGWMMESGSHAGVVTFAVTGLRVGGWCQSRSCTVFVGFRGRG